MVFAWIGIGIGILIVIILMIKAVKTSSKEVLRVYIYCKKCGFRTNGLKCPECENRKSFDI